MKGENINKTSKNKAQIIRVKVRPGAGHSAIVGNMSDGTLKVDIKAQAENGKANRELISFLAKEFSVSSDMVKILSGAGDRLKLIKINK
jgi:hypothetical protein